MVIQKPQKVGKKKEDMIMKKTFNNFRTLAALLMAGAAFAACSSDDNIIENQQPANPGEQVYTLTINASKGDGTTRALTLDGTGKLTASWANGDVLTVVNRTKSFTALGGTLTASNVSADGKTATFSGALTGTIEPNDKLMLFYHEINGVSSFSNQDGTLKGTNGAEKYDLAMAVVTVVSVNAGEITIDESYADFYTEVAMLKLTLQDGSSNPLNATSLTISVDGLGDLLTLSPSASAYAANGDGILYFAMPTAAGLGGDPALATATVTFTATAGGTTYTATKTGYKFADSKYYAATLTMAPDPIDLSTVTTNRTVPNGGTLTGTLTNNVQISIAAGASVTLDDVSINASGTWTEGDYAGITCLGDATIILSGTNTLKGFAAVYPGINVPSGSTLTIQGTGSLSATGSTYGAGIGGSGWGAGGNIVIAGGTVNAIGGEQYAAGIGSSAGGSFGTISITGGNVTATGSQYASGGGAGIGSASSGSCGNISITGGTVQATGGPNAAGIGGSYGSTNGTINISNGVTQVTATKGDWSPNSIGAGNGSTSCGAVTIAAGANVTQN